MERTKRTRNRCTPSFENLLLVIALGVGCLGVAGCVVRERPAPPPPDGSAQVRVLATHGAQVECEQAIEELLAMGPAVVPQIADALHRLPPETDGSWLGEALFAFGEKATPAGEAVLSRLVLGTPTAWVMAAVLDVSGPEGHKLLLRALAPHLPETCLVAALGKIEANNESAVRAVARLIDHESTDVRSEAMRRLGESGERGRSHLDLIQTAFRDPSDSVRYAAVEAAASVAAPGDATTADAIGDVLMRETDSSVVGAAIQALLAIKARTPTVRRGLERVAANGEDMTRADAQAALRELFSGGR